MAEHPVGQQELANREHLGPQKTGDNIAAKRVASYGFDGTNWQRIPLPLVPVSYDYIGVNNSGSTTKIYSFYQGGSGGTLVSTVTIGYTDSTKTATASITRT